MTATSARPRGIAGFSIFTAAMLIVFVGLGVWQLQRRVEKHALDRGPGPAAGGDAGCAAAAVAMGVAQCGR